ncbi:MAG TPA: TonB-dependent receptor [Candidatus Binatia bacterium]|nr:TonB-dependent receptor [Candidatus Binatia bacterium]
MSARGDAGSWAALILLGSLALVDGGRPTRAEEPPVGDLTELSLEELMDTEVTSVSRKPERRAEAADAVYVITNEEIRRSGARTLADALRLAPGVQVARIDANKWAVGVRGFASRLARSVLVLMDGRSVYTPLFAGTYWEVQDTLLDDVDRIEIIRGPGGTLWGANAFNGVINIITKSARETKGGYTLAGGGTEERAFGGVRYGGQVGNDFHYRGYAKGFDRDAGFERGGPDYDGWRMGQSGFRTDWDAGRNEALTVQGDVYAGTAGQRATIATFREPFSRTLIDDADLSGANTLARWTRVFGPRSDLSLQAYYDTTSRREPTFREVRNTGDLDFQHRYRLAWWQEIVWGAGYRLSADRTEGVPGIRFRPEDRTLNLFSAFLQDEVTLVPRRLRVTVGSKFEHNDFSGFEVQPSGRILWTPEDRHTVWGSASRAVRTPSRIEHDLELTAAPISRPPFLAFPRLLGSEDFDAEKVVDYQIGYRVRPLTRLFLDVVGFYNRYDDLLSIRMEPPFTEARPGVPHALVPFVIDNGLHGESYGAEIAADTSLTDWWRLNAAYSYLNITLHHDAGVADRSQEVAAGASPHNLATVRSLMNLPSRFQLDVIVRYVDNLPAQAIGGYVDFDVRVARRFGRALELSLVGQNLAHAHHREFAGGTEVERGAYGAVRWWW